MLGTKTKHKANIKGQNEIFTLLCCQLFRKEPQSADGANHNDPL